MIHDLDETIKDILANQGKLNSGEIDIAFDQPTGDWAATLSRPTINLYLYDIRENTELRNRNTHIERDGKTGRHVFPPRRVDLSYLITVWARNPEDEHQLLWRVLHTLSKVKGIEPEDSKGQVRLQPQKMPVKVALPSDAVRNMPDLWGVMENQLKPSINLVITVALDLEEVIESPLVLTTEIKIGQFEEKHELTAISSTTYHIGGYVHAGDALIPRAEVFLLDTGASVRTDDEGRYVFAYMREGDYEVEVSAEGRKAKQFKITVPAENYDLAL